MTLEERVKGGAVRAGAAWGAYCALDSRPFHAAGSTYQPRGMRD